MASSVTGSPETGADGAALAAPARTEFDRIYRALRTLSKGNHTLLHAQDEQTLLEDMCRVIVEKGGYASANVAYAEQDERKSVRWLACVGFDKALLESLQYTWADTELGQSATGTAIRTGQPSIGRRLLTDPSYAGAPFARLREDAAKNGYGAVSAFPLRVDGKILGALAITAPDADAFGGEEVNLLAELAADLAYGIEMLRMRAKHREVQALIERQAYYDATTDLPNRTLLLQRLEVAILRAKDQHFALALLYLKPDIFDELNRVFGYRSGDQLLKELARRLAAVAKEGETLARVGEAGFALLLPKADADHAVYRARRLMAALHDPAEIAGVMVDPRMEIGIALYPGHGTNADALLRRAKSAVNDTRPRIGGYSIYMGGQEELNVRRLGLMADLRRAIDNNELLLYAQPKIHIPTRRICGAEALVRWAHPTLGMIDTGEFVKLAERAGLITQLTNWVLDAAFSLGYEWRENGMCYPLSVNLSAHDLREPMFIDHIRGLLSTWGLPVERIHFELTESAVMEDPAGSLETLTRLKALGTQLYIDDFGTGYSSLSYLQKLPVDSIKIDQSFVMPMVSSDESAVIVRSAIELSHNLELEVVAEGVDSEPTWHRLAELGCDVAQGYLISAPMPAAEFGAWAGKWEKTAPRA